MANEPQTFLNQFGMEQPEISAAIERAQSLLVDAATVRGMTEFSNADPTADRRKSNAVRGTSSWLAKAGVAAMTLLTMEDLAKLNSWPILLDRVLIHPPSFRDLADWWLFFAALEAETGFQLGACTGKKREARLTGQLIEALGSQGKIWAEAIAPAVTRYGATLEISEIDLEMGGGEQANGGDFGLILDFDGRTVQPSARTGAEEHRIIPIIFQSKRYGRPTADISQTNRTRGPQHTLLASNACAAAYIFYENEGGAATPLPPLVKPIENVPHGTKTDVLAESLDFATYLLRAATQPMHAPRARSADDALRMNFSKASRQDLTTIVIVSGDPGATNRYRSGLSIIEHQLRHHGDEDQHVHQER